MSAEPEVGDRIEPTNVLDVDFIHRVERVLETIYPNDLDDPRRYRVLDDHGDEVTIENAGGSWYVVDSE